MQITDALKVSKVLSHVLRRDSVFHLELQYFKFHKDISLGSTERNITRNDTCFDKPVSYFPYSSKSGIEK